MLSQSISQDAYNFSAAPKAVKARTKYREAPQVQEEPERSSSPTNIMWDQRVIRGNTYAAVVTTTREIGQQTRTMKAKSKKGAPKKIETNEIHAYHADVSTPRPVDGRKHVEVQTDENVEILTDKPPEYERDAQTDFYIDRPVNRLFQPRKIGEDKETQLWDGELFDFDSEIEPILQVLIGKTLEQGRMEVLEEEELRIMKEEQKKYDELRYAELVEAQKLEAEETRKLEESQRRAKQHKFYKEKAVLSHKKLISRVLAKEYLKNVKPNCLSMMKEQGTFRKPFDFELINTFLPWALDDVLEIEQEKASINETIITLNSVVLKNMVKLHEDAIHRENERLRMIEEGKKQQELDKIERRRQRAEARKQRAEEERIRLLREKISQTIIAKAEYRPNIFSQVLSDLDALGNQGPAVGLIGGIIGELLIVLSTLEDFKKIEEEGDPLASLKTIQITQEAVQKVIDFVVGDLVKEGKVEIGVTGEIENQLIETIDPELNLENLYTKPDFANEIRALLKPSINSFVLNTLRESAKEFGLKTEYIEMIVDAVINLILSPDEKARKIRLVKTTLDYSEDTKFEAITVLMPNIEAALPFDLIGAKKIKPSKKIRGSSKTEAVGTNDDVGSVEAVPLTSAEVIYEDAVSMFPLINEEMRLLVHQIPVSIVLRREILLFLSNTFKELDMKELEVLKRVNEKAEGIEEIVAKKFNRTLPVFLFEKN